MMTAQHTKGPRDDCLSSAAQDLLDSLEMLVWWVAQQDDQSGIENSLEKARAAIAKATGQPASPLTAEDARDVSDALREV